MRAAQLSTLPSSYDTSALTLPRATVRRALATTATMAGAGIILGAMGSAMPLPLWLSVASLGFAAVLLHFNRLGGQLLTRSILWANLLGGGAVLAMGRQLDSVPAWLFPISMGVALAAMGGRGTHPDSGRGTFSPKAFRRTFMATIVTALVGAQWAVGLGALSIWLGGWMPVAWPVFFGYAGLAAAGAYGLYRLRTWGLGALSLGNIAFLAGAFSTYGGDQLTVLGPLIAAAIVQLVMLLPVFARIVRG